MKVSLVSLAPTEEAMLAGKYALTPELLAATGARYSRNNEGLDTIVAKIDFTNTSRSVDAIFRMVDYGHASIADMAPVALFIDGISIWLASYLWYLCPTASGQESSTRYIQMNDDFVASIADPVIRTHAATSFAHYQQAVSWWTKHSQDDPTRMEIPLSVLQDTSESGQKKLERMRRNYVFDRARVFLPAVAKTNIMLIQSARAWTQLVSHLLSHPLLECQQVGAEMCRELRLVMPRMMKHAIASPELTETIVYQLRYHASRIETHRVDVSCHDGAYLYLYGSGGGNLAQDLQYRINRYSPCGDTVRSMGIQFGWTHIAFAEARDLNRHRTGNKVISYIPNGFYTAEDQIKESVYRQDIIDLATYHHNVIAEIRNRAMRGDFSYVYLLNLGHSMGFSHTTTLDKYIYEAELRTGIGAHYRYAYHMRNTLKILYTQHPELKGVIFEGSAEPE